MYLTRALLARAGSRRVTYTTVHKQSPRDLGKNLTYTLSEILFFGTICFVWWVTTPPRPPRNDHQN